MSEKIPPQDWAALAKKVRRAQELAESRRRGRKKGLQQVHTRATLAFKVSPVKITKPDLTQPAEYVPPGQSGLIDIGPRITIQHATEWAVFLRRETSREKKRPEDKDMLFKAGYRSACSDSKNDGKGCGARSCVLCSISKLGKPPKGWFFVAIELGTPDKMKITDAAGVDPRGKQSSGGRGWTNEDKWDCYKGMDSDLKRVTESERSENK